MHEATLLHLSIEKAQKFLKWFPRYDFDNAVRVTGEWYRQTQNGEDAARITKQQIQNFMTKLDQISFDKCTVSQSGNDEIETSFEKKRRG